MVKVKEDLTGMVFGRLTVLEQAEDYINVKSGQHYARWLCECSCKERNKIITHGSSLKNKRTQSCGCLRNNNIKNSCFRGNKFNLNDEYGVLFETNTGKEVRFDLENAVKTTLEDIGKMFGVTKECIRQTEARALNKMKINLAY